MRAYIAVIKDSFREAMASFLLWIALLGIAVVLLAIAPFGIQYDKSWKLRQSELIAAESLASEIYEARGSAESPGGHLWSLMTKDQQEEFTERVTGKEIQMPNGGPTRQRSVSRQWMVRLLNDLAVKPEFFNESAWAQIRISDETKALIADGSTVEEDISYRNIQLLKDTFPKVVVLRKDPAISVTYFGSVIIGPIDGVASQFSKMLDTFIIGLMPYVFGTFGVIGALVMTCSMIPRMLEPGEVSLLLSKPVNRAALFLIKYFGGCIFAAICSIFLVGGVWLILGIRLDHWRHELLWCIPVYLFAYAVYFAVVATAGLIWRNAIASFAMFVLFWGVVLSIGIVKGVCDTTVIMTRKVIEITPTDESLFVVDGGRTVLKWDESSEAKWSPVFRTEIPGMPVFLQRVASMGKKYRPIWDAEKQRLLTVRLEPGRSTAQGPATLVSGRMENDYEQEIEGVTPGGVFGVYQDSNGRILLPGRKVIYRFVGQSEEAKKKDQFIRNMFGGLVKPESKAAFEEVQSEKLPNWSDAAISAFDAGQDRFVVLDQKVIYRLDSDSDGKFAVKQTRSLETDSTAVMGISGNHVVIAFADGKILILNAGTLENVVEHSLRTGDAPRTIEAAADGSRVAVLTHEGDVIMFDAKNAQFVDNGEAVFSGASAIAFNNVGDLYVAFGRQAVYVYDQSLTQIKLYDPGSDIFYTLYDFVVSPIHYLLPRPSELNMVVAYLVTGEKTVAIGNDNDNALMGQVDLQQDRLAFNIWGTFFSNLAFVVVLLGFGCLYVSRSDF